MPESRQFKPAVLLVVLPLLAAAVIFQQKYLTQAQSLQASAMQQGSPRPTLPSSPLIPLLIFRPSMYSAIQKAVLKQARTTPKMMPERIRVSGASLPVVNGAYTLASGFDGNGFRYFQNGNATQYCQWSTIGLCWCIRSSLIMDAINSKPSAEYISSGRQTYREGPAGTYELGGMGFTRGRIMWPTVTAVGTSSHDNTHY